ncbi:hypothetical protein [Pantoea agglomerans]|uniref:hypothetical protein n=1 Tax=Enterobacter agglomerans TaxID=549 RepID=UPI0017856583|nr:hypothetical protein [Pantoea agglomerans]MBD8260523.1 hypothetical protein [Pantoea agglomerans]
MRSEKIITIYPTVIKAGLAIDHFMPPDPVIFVGEYPARCSFYLTSLMYFENGKEYTTELDVSLNGTSVLPDDSDDNSMETFMFCPTDNSSIMVGSSLYVKNVQLLESGVYDISFKLYEQIDGKLGELIDEKSCAIISTAIPRS